MIKPNTFRLHGLLYHTFNNAMTGGPLLKIAFRPQQKTALTYLLWGLSACMLASAALTFPLTDHQDWFFLICIGLMPVFFVAELAIQRGVSEAFPGDEVVSNLRQQPWKLRRPIIRYAFLSKSLQEQSSVPSVDELGDCLEFIEINRKGRPPRWTSFLRHPLVVTVFGILIFMFNSQIIAPHKGGNNWSFFGNVCLFVFFLLFVGGVAYGLRYVDPNIEWQFECCIRWYRLRRQESLGELKRVRVNRQAKDGDRQSAA
jgi:hypothetical protein